MREHQYDDGVSLFRGAGSQGKWATEQMLRCMRENVPFSAAALRTADVLRHEEWVIYDTAVIEEAQLHLNGIADLIAAGLTRPIPNSMGKTLLGYERMSDMGPATVSMDGITRSENDAVEFNMGHIPLPITHKDFNINLRRLAASREGGESLDTTQSRISGRKCAEMQEQMLFSGGKTFSGAPIYGYSTHPNRISLSFNGGLNWNDPAKTGASFLLDVQNMVNSAQARRQFGPFWIYYGRGTGVNLDSDFKATGTETIRERLMKVEGVKAIKVTDYLAAGNVVMIPVNREHIVLLQGEKLQTVQWDLSGGFDIAFKAFMIQVPLVRGGDIQGRCGIVHMV